MDQDGDVVAIADELADAADVVGMAVGADDSLELVASAADATQVPLQHHARADHPGIDERQAILGDEERVRAEHPDLVHGSARSPSGSCWGPIVRPPSSPGRR